MPKIIFPPNIPKNVSIIPSLRGLPNFSELLKAHMASTYIGSTAIKENYAGLRMELSYSGVNYAASIATDILSRRVTSIPIQDFKGNTKVVVGKVDYEFTNLKIVGFNKPFSDVVINPNQGVTWRLSNGALSLHGNWRYKYKVAFFKIRDHGTFVLGVNGVSLGVAATITSGPSGELDLMATGSSGNIADVSVKFHGGASWLYNLFRGVVARKLQKIMENFLREEVVNIINGNGKNQIRQLRMEYAIKDNWIMNYRLTRPPVFKRDYVQSFHKGELYYKGENRPNVLLSESMPDLGSPSMMLRLCVSDYVFNTIGQLLYTKGILSVSYTADKFPAAVQKVLSLRCSSGCFGEFFPEIAAQHPDGTVAVGLSVSKAPTVINDAEGANIVMTGTVSVKIVSPSKKQETHLLQISLNVNVSIGGSLNNQILRGYVRKITPEVISVTSSLFDVNVAQRSESDDIVEILLNAFVVPKLNEVGHEGLPLTGFDNVRYVDTSMSLHTNTVCLQTNAQYIP